MSKLGARFHETKVFKVLNPSGAAVLVDQDKKPFDVSFYAPQSDRMQDWDEEAARARLLKSAKENRASQVDFDEMQLTGALRIAHAIEWWHPVSPEGVAITEEELPFDELAIAEALLDRDVKWWLTEQLTDFFKTPRFALERPSIQRNAKTKKTSERVTD